MLPEDYRRQYGVYYSPPAITARLLDLSQKAGVDWSSARILDPACGGGAFLAPTAKRMVESLPRLTPENRLAHIEEHLCGYEIDPFSAWVSQAFVELALQDDIAKAGRPLSELVEVRDSLDIQQIGQPCYDLVIGNPPYGRTKLNEEQRDYWSRSLYGHANLYGIFSDLAARVVAPGGVVAFITPTSFLGGQYFQALRKTLARETPPIAFDFISEREGVFSDALQETLLSVYRKSNRHRRVAVSYLSVTETGKVKVRRNGKCSLPSDSSQPWILPRNPAQSELAGLVSQMPARLSDLGYAVSTGPLVWNRHKSKLHCKKVKGAIPLVWAECVDPQGSGDFTYKATMRNHAPWFKPAKTDGANIVTSPCVLVQRTTAVEQTRRLIAAEMPLDFINQHGGAVTVENHLNMVKPINGQEQLVSFAVIAALLNSETVDQVFRCINGSTAVSAYELGSMPLPPPQELSRLEGLIERHASREILNKAIKEIYTNVRISVAA
jgi:adenine-specific DNA-methyltransferase